MGETIDKDWAKIAQSSSRRWCKENPFGRKDTGNLGAGYHPTMVETVVETPQTHTGKTDWEGLKLQRIYKAARYDALREVLELIEELKIDIQPITWQPVGRVYFRTGLVCPYDPLKTKIEAMIDG